MIDRLIGVLMCSSRASRISNGFDHIETLSRAGGTRNDGDAAVAQAQRFEHFITNLDLFNRVSRQRYADSVANSCPQQSTHANGRFDGAAGQPAGFGDAQVNGCVGRLGQRVIGGSRQKHIRGFAGDLELVKIVVEQDADVIQPAFDHRIGAGFAVFFQKMLFPATRR